jgi:hypothetical protein
MPVAVPRQAAAALPFGGEIKPLCSRAAQKLGKDRCPKPIAPLRFPARADLGMDRPMTTRSTMSHKGAAPAIAVLAAAILGASPLAAAPDGIAAISCTNPVSGTKWEIIVDYAKSTVDANPARITAADIFWFDPKDGGHYTLDRKSGALVAGVASSTGGYFRRGRCDLGSAR